MISQSLGKVSKIRLEPYVPGSGYIRLHFSFRKSPPINLELKVGGAVTLMRLLQSRQKKHGWPTPMLRIPD
jgi:hypothetical protein